MGSSSSNIKYDLRIIFNGNPPQEIINRILLNNEISHENNQYYFYEKYYIFLRRGNENITSKEDIKNIIDFEVPNKNGVIFRKNVIICSPSHQKQ